MKNPPSQGSKKQRKATRRDRSLQRKPPSRDERPRFLIVCEGEKREKYYFEKMRSYYRYPEPAVEVVGKDGSGTNPKSLVKYAKVRKHEFDAVWCVFDRDEHEYFNEAIQQAKDNGINTAISNPCVELWFLLHFKDQRRHIERDAAKSALKKRIKDYDDDYEGVFQRIHGDVEAAKKRAKDLRATHERNGNAETENPSSSVDLLVDFLEIHKPQ